MIERRIRAKRSKLMEASRRVTLRSLEAGNDETSVYYFYSKTLTGLAAGIHYRYTISDPNQPLGTNADMWLTAEPSPVSQQRP